MTITMPTPSHLLRTLFGTSGKEHADSAATSWEPTQAKHYVPSSTMDLWRSQSRRFIDGR